MFELSICVPTYNRLADLQEGLNHLLPQVEPYLDKVELIVVNNASSDGTKAWLDEFKKSIPWIKVIHNDRNVGFDGNTIRCLRASVGRYVAILSDDDRYVPGAVPKILDLISKQEYSLLFLNYYGYYQNVSRRSVFVAPEKDILFSRACGIIQQPGVGHYSGYVYPGERARQILEEILLIRDRKGKADPNVAIRVRSGIYNEVALRVTLNTDHPSLFVGKRLMAAQIRGEYDDCGVPPGKGKFEEIVISLYEFYEELARDGVFPAEDLGIHYNTAKGNIAKVTIQSVPCMSRSELVEISAKLKRIFGSQDGIRFWIWIIDHGHIPPVRWGCSLIYQLGRRILKLKYLKQSKENS